MKIEQAENSTKVTLTSKEVRHAIAKFLTPHTHSGEGRKKYFFDFSITAESYGKDDIRLVVKGCTVTIVEGDS